MTTGTKVAVGLLTVIGLLLIVIGIVYYVMSPADLPSFLPGHDKPALRHHRRGALVGFIGLISLSVAAMVWYRFSRPPYSAE